MNAHQKMTSAEEEFSNQADKKTCSMGGQPLFPVILVIASGPVIKATMVAEMEIIHGPEDIDFQSPAGHICFFVPGRPAAETNTEPLI